jgi:hypothetical protein
VFGRGATLAWINDELLEQFGESDPAAARSAARRWFVQICLHAYVAVGEDRPEAAEVLSRCRFAAGAVHGLPPTASGHAVWQDELARFSHVFALALRARDRDSADKQEASAEARRCHAEVDWQRHLAGLEPSNRVHNPDECKRADPLQSGPRPDECLLHDSEVSDG